MLKQQRDREPEKRRDPDWITRLVEERLANGGGPDWPAAQRAFERLEELTAGEEPLDLGDEDVDDIIDGMGLRKNIAGDWPVVPWSYWEARGAGPYRR